MATRIGSLYKTQVAQEKLTSEFIRWCANPKHFECPFMPIIAKGNRYNGTKAKY